MAQAPGEEIARRAFEDGVSLEKKGDYAAALEKFKESEKVKATFGNRFHKAYCLEMTGKLAAALIEYEVLERSAREANKNDVADQTHARLETLLAKVPQVGLKLGPATPSDTEVTLDGAPVAPALLEGKTFRVDIGEHTVKARAAGREPFSKTFNAAEKSTTWIDIVLASPTTGAAAASKPAEDAETEPPTEEHSRSAVLPIVTTAGAVVLVAGGVASFLAAGSAQSDLEKTCKQKPSCEDDKGTTRTLDALALGGFIGGAGLAALSLVLWSSRGSSSATVTARPSWVGVEGRF